MLLIRAVPEEKVLRSVEDLPGIVGIGVHTNDGSDEVIHEFAIDPAWEPSKAQLAETQKGTMKVEHRVWDGAPRVDWLSLEDCIEACADKLALQYLLGQVSAHVEQVHELYGQRGMWELLIGAAQLAADTRDAVARRLQGMTE